MIGCRRCWSARRCLDDGSSMSGGLCAGGALRGAADFPCVVYLDFWGLGAGRLLVKGAKRGRGQYP